MISEGQKGVKNVFLWAVNTIVLYLGPNEATGLKKSKQFLLVVRSLCSAALLPMLGAGSCTSELDLQLKIVLFWKYVLSKLLEKVLEKFMNTHVIHF